MIDDLAEIWQQMPRPAMTALRLAALLAVPLGGQMLWDLRAAPSAVSMTTAECWACGQPRPVVPAEVAAPQPKRKHRHAG